MTSAKGEHRVSPLTLLNPRSPLVLVSNGAQVCGRQQLHRVFRSWLNEEHSRLVLDPPPPLAQLPASPQQIDPTPDGPQTLSALLTSHPEQLTESRSSLDESRNRSAAWRCPRCGRLCATAVCR